MQPEMEALLHVSRGAAQFGGPHAVDVDLGRTELERALDLARAHDLGHLEVQSLWMLAMLAAMRRDHRNMAAIAEHAVAAAARRGRHPSAWSAPPAMLALSWQVPEPPWCPTPLCCSVTGSWPSADEPSRSGSPAPGRLLGVLRLR